MNGIFVKVQAFVMGLMNDMIHGDDADSFRL